MSRPAADELTRVRRQPDRGRYDGGEVAAVLDAAFVCHVGTVRQGRPVVIPTLYARNGDHLVLHGSPVAGIFRDLGRAPEVCVTVTVVDGLVLARSAFHHSVNYRSAVVHGTASEITDPAAKRAAFRVLTEHVAPGQWDVVRQPNAEELRQSSAWSVPLDRASAKVRSGPPADDEADLDLPVWAGVLPLGLVAGEPVADGHVPPDRRPPAHITGWRPGVAVS